MPDWVMRGVCKLPSAGEVERIEIDEMRQKIVERKRNGGKLEPAAWLKDGIGNAEEKNEVNMWIKVLK